MISRTSICVLNCSVALMKLAEMEHCGTTRYFNDITFLYYPSLSRAHTHTHTLLELKVVGGGKRRIF